MDGATTMEQRQGDSHISIDRKIPLWGILCVCGALIAQGVLLWSASREYAIRLEFLGQTVSASTNEIKSLATQIATKSEQDILQNADIKDIQRRLAEVERRAKP